MCGIFALFNRFKHIDTDIIINGFNSLKHRGPDSSVMKQFKFGTFDEARAFRDWASWYFYQACVVIKRGSRNIIVRIATYNCADREI